MKKPITKRALVQRVNRVLRREGKQLRAGRGEGVGDFYIVHGKSITPNVKLEVIGRQLGVLKPHERLER